MSKKITQKYLTENKFGVFEKSFEKSMTSIAKSFDRIDERFEKIDERFDRQDKAFGLLLKQMQAFTEESREHRQSMSSLMRTDVSQEKNIEDLKIRVERLEMHIK
jgi:septation ring formation regulator EzrA